MFLSFLFESSDLERWVFRWGVWSGHTVAGNTPARPSARPSGGLVPESCALPWLSAILDVVPLASSLHFPPETLTGYAASLDKWAMGLRSERGSFLGGPVLRCDYYWAPWRHLWELPARNLSVRLSYRVETQVATLEGGLSPAQVSPMETREHSSGDHLLKVLKRSERSVLHRGRLQRLPLASSGTI